MPPLDIHRGGYIGLDATPLERLAGALCLVNQHDTKDRLSVNPRTQDALEKVCAEFKLRWRKERLRDGTLKPGARTFITDCYDEWKRLYDSPQPPEWFKKFVKLHFPGYPEKHLRMESLHVQKRGLAPPRRKRRSDTRLRNLSKKVLDDRDRESIPRHVVVCRVCRMEVAASEWKDHLGSSSHRSLLPRK